MSELTDGKASNRRVWLGLGLILLIAGVILLAVGGGLKYRRVCTCSESALARLRILQDLAPEATTSSTDLDLMLVGAQLQGLQGDLACLRAEVREFLPLAPLLGWVPGVGPDVASAPILLDMAQALVDGGVLVSDSLSPLAGQIQSGDLGLDLAGATAALDAARPALAEAEQKLGTAAKLQTALNAEALSPRLGRLLQLTERYLPLLRTGVKAARIAPELLGADGTRTYLILAQNDDERRPTGGWISGMGLLTVAQGNITGVSFQDSWAVDNLAVPHEFPPDSMYRVLWAEMWLFRDANWSPDFPSSAQIAERILESDQGISVDGVIAVDQQALRLLVQAMEPLAVGSNDEPVTGANVLNFIRDAWTEPQEGLGLTENRQEWAEHRKDFMADLVGGIVDKAQTQPHTVDLSSLAQAIWKGLQERHILVYLHDPEAAELLATQRWDGALLSTPGDYLQVVDANVGFNKLDPNVQRTIVYDVDLTDPTRAQAEVAVHYRNASQRIVGDCVQQIEWLPTYQERMHGCYWDYVRLYVPEGTHLLTEEREPLPPGSLLARYAFAPPGDAGPDLEPLDRDKAAYGVFFVLEPEEEKEVRLAWQLASGVVQKEADGWHYQLLVQKQSGAPPIPLKVTVSLPPSSRLVMAEPEPHVVQDNALTFQLSLAADHHVEIVFHDSGGGEP
jgi:hypothetical protein